MAPGFRWRRRVIPRSAGPAEPSSRTAQLRARSKIGVQPSARPDWAQRLTSVGSIATVAVAIAALLYTNQANVDQRRITEQGQITDRYGRAIEQIGNDALDVRVGGIFALERVMRDSPPDQSTIVEVLTAFVRVHSAGRVTPPTPKSVGAERLMPAAPADIQAALTVIGRRDPRHDGKRRIDLSYANLYGADLSDANLAGAELEGADLTGATMYRADLTRAHLLAANLSFASCRWANFTDAGMVNSVLVNAFLYDANLTGADMAFADLTQAFLSGATLTGADLSNAKLAGIVEANLTGTKR